MSDMHEPRSDSQQAIDAARPADSDHPVATGVGAAVGGAAGGLMGAATAGAAVGGMTGPVGAVVGAVVGVVAGAVMGKGAARAIDPDAETAYWRDSYTSRPYVAQGASFNDYEPAYRYGMQARTRHPDRQFDEVESELGRDWGAARSASSLEWEHAKHATRDAWDRVSDKVERAIPGDSDRDGK